MANGTVRRKVKFYRIEAERDQHGALLSFDPSIAIAHIQGLAHGLSRQVDKLDEYLYCWIDSASSPYMVRISATRTSNLPPVQTGQSLSPLTLSTGGGLAEITHVVFFRRNIVGIEYNHYGPRAGQLAKYLRTKCPAAVPPGIKFTPLLNPAVSEALKDAQAIRMFHFQIRRSDIDVVKHSSETLHRGLRAQLELGESGEVGVYMKQEGNTRGVIDSSYIDLAKALAENSQINEINTSALKVKIVNNENKSEEIDLLKEQMSFTMNVERESNGTKSLKSESAFSAVLKAYEANRDLIETASAIDFNDDN